MTKQRDMMIMNLTEVALKLGLNVRNKFHRGGCSYSSSDELRTSNSL